MIYEKRANLDVLKIEPKKSNQCEKVPILMVYKLSKNSAGRLFSRNLPRPRIINDVGHPNFSLLLVTFMVYQVW